MKRRRSTLESGMEKRKHKMYSVEVLHTYSTLHMH